MEELVKKEAGNVFRQSSIRSKVYPKKKLACKKNGWPFLEMFRATDLIIFRQNM